MTTIDRTTDLPGDDGHHDEGSYLSPSRARIATILNWAVTVDHKKIGVMYLFAVLFMFFLGGVAALAVRMELLEPVRMAR
jgi:cytochrome c oxidase subunit 1